MSETRFQWWHIYKDGEGRTWVIDPHEMGRSDSPSDARKQHRMACEFGWVREGMLDASVSDLMVETAFGKQAVVQDGAFMSDYVKSKASRAPQSAYEARLTQ